MKLLYPILDYLYDNKLPRQALYWLSYLLLCISAFSLPLANYIGVLVGAILLNWHGLIQGSVLANGDD